MSELAPAKINLTLTVLGRRPDGYHDLESLVTFADLHDVVTFEPGTRSEVSVAGPFARDIGGENLLVRALAVLRNAEPALQLGAVHLDKHLPVAAGLGGGSADAAALLRAVRRANPELASGVSWSEIAARLGADVPVCYAGRPALMWGKGENLEPVARLSPAHAVLVNPRSLLATRDVFEALAAGPAASTNRRPTPPDLSRHSDLLDYMRAHDNDLEPAAIRLVPQIARVKAALEEQGGRAVRMAGSGPTCFAIFSDRSEAQNAAARIAETHEAWWVGPALLQGAAPP